MMGDALTVRGATGRLGDPCLNRRVILVRAENKHGSPSRPVAPSIVICGSLHGHDCPLGLGTFHSRPG